MMDPTTIHAHRAPAEWKMYMRTGPSNPEISGDDARKDHLHIDGIILYSRAAADRYIARIVTMRDTVWPLMVDGEDDG